MNVGAELRQAREARGLSIAAVAATTRIPAKTIEALERNDLSAIPPRPYSRGFVAVYAREVGLPPDRTARAYLEQFEPADEAPPSLPRAPADAPIRSWGALTGAATALLLLLTFVLWPTRVDRADLNAVGTSGRPAAAVKPARIPDSPGDAHSAAPMPVGAAPVTPAAHPAILVVLEADRPAWVAATADGRRVLYRTIQPGVPHTVTASGELAIRVGDAGAVRWSVDGRESEPMGRNGQVRTVTLRR